MFNKVNNGNCLQQLLGSNNVIGNSQLLSTGKLEQQPGKRRQNRIRLNVCEDGAFTDFICQLLVLPTKLFFALFAFGFNCSLCLLKVINLFFKFFLSPLPISFSRVLTLLFPLEGRFWLSFLSLNVRCPL